jgi:hypothetical protein
MTKELTRKMRNYHKFKNHWILYYWMREIE